MTTARDLSRHFTLAILALWIALVGLPLLVSLALGAPATGIPLVGVALWFGAVRLARAFSPAARADRLIQRGRSAGALALCDAALAVSGRGRWMGVRRLSWLNRRTLVLLSAGQFDRALGGALDALAASADPETLGNCAMALLRLNRYDEAAAAAKLALSLTRHRSLVAHAALAEVMLARSMPAEAEALALSGVEDARALLPLVRQEHYVWCLAAACRAARTLARRATARELAGESREESRAATAYLSELRAAARANPALRSWPLLEEADGLADAPATREQAVSILRSVMDRWPENARWYVTQPGTLAALRDDPALQQFTQTAEAWLAEIAAVAPSAEVVAAALAAAEPVAQARPPGHANSIALAVQVVTLASTFLLLLLWTWRFFVALS